MFGGSLLARGCRWQTKPHRCPYLQNGRGTLESQEYDGDTSRCKGQVSSFTQHFIIPRSKQWKTGLTVLLRVICSPRSVTFLRPLESSTAPASPELSAGWSTLPSLAASSSVALHASLGNFHVINSTGFYCY